jgi:CBS domain-containing protein
MGKVIDKIENRVISSSTSILDAMKKMDVEKVKLLFVFHEGKFNSILTIGDIQRAIIKGNSLMEPVFGIMSPNKIYGKPTDSKEDIRGKMQKLHAECMPIVDEAGELVDVLFTQDVFDKRQPESENRLAGSHYGRWKRY